MGGITTRVTGLASYIPGYCSRRVNFGEQDERNRVTPAIMTYIAFFILTCDL